MSQMPETKNAFQVSADVQEQFVNSLAQTMAVLSRKKEHDLIGASIPFSAASGRAFSGANMVRLMLTSIEKGYADDRWMTFKQIEQFQKDNPDMVVHVRKGEKGTRVLQAQEVHFIVGEDGKREILSRERLAEIEQLKDADAVPDVQTGILYYPYTVFNAQQIEGFPEKENPAPAMSSEEKQEFIDRFIASAGVHAEYVDYRVSYYDKNNDILCMPTPELCEKTDPLVVSAMKLRDFFHATGHNNRENRLPPSDDTLTLHTHEPLEEMRGELFSIMAGKYLGIPSGIQIPAGPIQDWNAKFTGNDSREIFQAATQAGKIITTLHQFKSGAIPQAKWFPSAEKWEDLCIKQHENNNLKEGEVLLSKALHFLKCYTVSSSSLAHVHEYAISMKEELEKQTPSMDGILRSLNMTKRYLNENLGHKRNIEYLILADKRNVEDFITRIGNFTARFEEGEHGEIVEISHTKQSTKNFSEIHPVLARESSEADKENAPQDLVSQALKIFQNPEFLDMAMKQDPEGIKDLASLCDSMAMALSRELDERSRDASAPMESVPTSHRRMKA